MGSNSGRFTHMPTPTMLLRLSEAKARFDELRVGKDELLRILDESEIPEAVFNSNAIENSTLTLEETEQILLAVEISRHMDLREVHEAQNLARVTQYLRTSSDRPLDLERLTLLHRMLLGNIVESIAGRFRSSGEYVRVGTHVAPAPEAVEQLLRRMLTAYGSDVSSRPTQRLARLHMEFERIHPFVDGNGRIGRVLLNDALYRLGFPPVIVRNKGKLEYYAMLRRYDADGTIKSFEDHLVALMLESLHRRITYLAGQTVRTVADEARRRGLRVSSLLNQAGRQTIPAFRERGVWKIGVEPTSSPT
jgi:Fic family protein